MPNGHSCPDMEILGKWSISHVSSAIESEFHAMNISGAKWEIQQMHSADAMRRALFFYGRERYIMVHVIRKYMREKTGLQIF